MLAKAKQQSCGHHILLHEPPSPTTLLPTSLFKKTIHPNFPYPQTPHHSPENTSRESKTPKKLLFSPKAFHPRPLPPIRSATPPNEPTARPYRAFLMVATASLTSATNLGSSKMPQGTSREAGRRAVGKKVFLEKNGGIINVVCFFLNVFSSCVFLFTIFIFMSKVLSLFSFPKPKWGKDVAFLVCFFSCWCFYHLMLQLGNIFPLLI